MLPPDKLLSKFLRRLPIRFMHCRQAQAFACPMEPCLQARMVWHFGSSPSAYKNNSWISPPASVCCLSIALTGACVGVLLLDDPPVKAVQGRGRLPCECAGRHSHAQSHGDSAQLVGFNVPPPQQEQSASQHRSMWAPWCAHAGRFPFKEAADENLPQQTKLKAMFPRIAKAVFQRPTWVSPGCCDLLNGMLQPDPDTRLTVAGVMAHPWFLQGACLPPSAIFFWLAPASLSCWGVKTAKSPTAKGPWAPVP